MSFQRLIITTDLTADGFKSVCDLSPLQLPAANNFENYIAALTGGNQMAKLDFNVGAVQATASITSTGTAGNNETMKLCNETLTAKSSGAVPANGEFNVSATVGTQATNIAAAINAMPELQSLVSAVANAGVVTVTALVPGAIGNGLECADVNLANVAVAGFANGSDGTNYIVDLR